MVLQRTVKRISSRIIGIARKQRVSFEPYRQQRPVRCGSINELKLKYKRIRMTTSRALRRGTVRRVLVSQSVSRGGRRRLRHLAVGLGRNARGRACLAVCRPSGRRRRCWRVCTGTWPAVQGAQRQRVELLWTLPWRDTPDTAPSSSC